MVAFTSSTFDTMESEWVSRLGNLPALLSPGPRIRGICLIRESDARKASYRLAVSKDNETFTANSIFKFTIRVAQKERNTYGQ